MATDWSVPLLVRGGVYCMMSARDHFGQFCLRGVSVCFYVLLPWVYKGV